MTAALWWAVFCERVGHRQQYRELNTKLNNNNWGKALIPDLDQHGLLPPGIHDCTLAEIAGRFCFTERRKTLFDGLSQFLNVEWNPLGADFPLLIDGSFTRNKPNPDDIDVVMDLTSDPFCPAAIQAFGFWVRHAEIKEAYNLDVWPKHPRVANDLVQFSQYLGDKAGAELSLPPKHPKGLLRVMP